MHTIEPKSTPIALTIFDLIKISLAYFYLKYLFC